MAGDVPDPGRGADVTVYDAAGELTSVTDPAGNVTAYAYDDFGRQTGTTNPDSTSTTTAYDASGDVTSTSDLDSTGKTLSTTSSTYDGDGNELSSTDALGNTTTFTYDPSGSVTQEVQPVSASSGITTSFGYDAAGNKTRYTDGNGDNWYYTYNSWGLPETRVEPTTSAYSSAANSTYTMAYDADARAVSETEPGGVTIADSYNNSGELTGESGTGADAADRHADTGVRPRRAADVGDHVEHGDRDQPVERHQRVVHLQRPGPGADLLRARRDRRPTATTVTAWSPRSRTRPGPRRTPTTRRTGCTTLSDPASGTTATYTYNNDNMVSQISYGSDVTDPGVRLAAPADERHAQDVVGHDGSVRRLRLRRGLAADLAEHDRSGRRLVELLHL